MLSVFLKRKSLSVATFACLLGLGAPAHAATVTIQFSGLVTAASTANGGFTHPINVGDTFSGSYTFSTTLPDAEPTSTLGEYHYATGAGFGLTTTINGMTFQTATDLSGSNRIEVFHADPFNDDRYAVWNNINAPFNGVGVTEQILFLDDPTNTANVSDALPATAPDLGAFASRTFSLVLNNGNAASAPVDFALNGAPLGVPDGFQGEIISLSIAGTPEPASVGLLSLAAITALARRRRRA